MKRFLFFWLIALLGTAAGKAQIQSYISDLKTSESGPTVAELSLMHRSRTNSADIRDLGSRTIIIPEKIEGQELTIATYRFRTYEGNSFEMEGTAYVPVVLYYDNHTIDVKDDLYIASIPFPVEKDLLLEELEHYHGSELGQPKFVEAPRGKTIGKVFKVKMLKDK